VQLWVGRACAACSVLLSTADVQVLQDLWGGVTSLVYAAAQGGWQAIYLGQIILWFSTARNPDVASGNTTMFTAA
jgi:hypothetical protein